ncbi:MAG TPA: type IV-A pilus assembly ATPase PilB [Deltaproteobacteria bacterium]|nr:MAG: type IV-A pilus assembly ATPase PilB [Deltaproteobacteria bacterium GWA2_55_82]OGQ63415.1 MAG: type IV-A pilus assembly ATPase PilB [Deltaproteobacteria bacterium RIFCSPLOWO2_02_FULL_55_12]OIJ73171.1 MAG: type IV-A pilus assembly ATPase PilB [Deltaproteobacteria bacterium GWC2_55_46]HBG45574.1 type IV-A pilus assembly ATPase PilB [Deltaproteobacteria bacterium]HCY10405.1 type IV-A pilus assembly ATPase PilB [Deltaproteobacteria bacterium]
MTDRIGELLLRERLITPEQLKKAIDEQKKSGGRLGFNLAKLGYITEKDLTSFLSRQYGIPTIDLSVQEVDHEIVKLIPEDVAQKYQVIPVTRTGSTLVVAMADPSNIFAIDDIKFLTGYNVEPLVASDTAIKSAIEKYYETPEMGLEGVLTEFDEGEMEVIKEEEEVDLSDLKKAVEDAPVVKLVNLILTDAIKKGASDIHIEPYEKHFRVRYRIDGVLMEVMKPPMKLKNAIVSRIKIMSNLDIAERRLPQDGRIKLKLSKNKEMDYRVSVLPTLFGEKVCCRLLDKANLQLDMTKLGFEEKALKDFMGAIHRPWGIVLVTGPTGSGKTTTLYSALSELNKISENISTAEDPVEFNLMGINQVQMHEDIGLNFAASLRSFLRQDPDIIMVGEVRDYETAEIAIKAALTGHLVLSTLHTNDAPSTVNRLLNMGIEPFLVSSSCNLILAQRLARKICKDCRVKAPIAEKVLLDLGVTPEEAKKMEICKGNGCATCGGSGYKGRIALYEVMPFTDTIKDLVLNGASSVEIKRAAIKDGMKSLRMSGVTKAGEGVTTLEEVLRVTMAD